MPRRLAVATGVLGTVAVFLVTVLGGAGFPGYSHATQFISELGARGAPHARLVNLLGFLPAGLLLGAYAFFARRSLPRSRLTTLAWIGLAGFAFGYAAAAFFPCDPGCRPARPSPSQLVHNLAGLTGYLLAPPSLLILGGQARRWPRARWLSTLGFLCGGAALLSLLFLSPDFRYVGVVQRALEGSVLGWVLASALYLRAAPPPAVTP